MPRFHIPELPAAGSQAELPERVVRHIQVLRLNAGDALTLFDGSGREAPAVLLSLGRRSALCRVDAPVETDRESPLHITLIQAVSAGERMDFTLQKSVELGVAAIQPVLGGRSVVRLSGERADKRQARWQEIAVSACEQCGRNRVPQVLSLLDLPAALDALADPAALRLLASPHQAAPLSSFRQPESCRLQLMVGPEGGWTPQEEALARERGFAAFTLGPRILRTETAALAAISALQTLWGDFGA